MPVTFRAETVGSLLRPDEGFPPTYFLLWKGTRLIQEFQAHKVEEFQPTYFFQPHYGDHSVQTLQRKERWTTKPASTWLELQGTSIALQLLMRFCACRSEYEYARRGCRAASLRTRSRSIASSAIA
jgi:hypothetical protein